MSIFRGGRASYGEAIGILLLDTRFPRMPGDIGNATTFDFPVRLRVVEGATVQRIIMDGDDTALDDFVRAARKLEAEGVRAITTTCGYLTTIQELLIEAVTVPVFCSALLQVPMVARMLPRGKKVGVLTLDSRRLTETHLRAAGISDEPVVLMGAEEAPAYYDNCAGGVEAYDPADVEAAVVGLARDLTGRHPEVGAIVCEGINFAPYAAAVQEATGLPWFDIVDLTRLVHSALVKRRFEGFL